MRAKSAGWFLGLAVAVIGLAVAPVFAQVETSEGVARVSLIQGDVTTERADSGSWVAATINTPLVPGDTIATGAGARAEVQLDYADIVRLDQNTEVKIADLTRSRIQLQVAHGLVDYVVTGNPGASSEVDTPNVAVEPSGAGVFRIDVNSQDLSLVTVRQGSAQIATPQGSTTVNEGQQITVQGADNPEYQIADAQPQDGWDRWNRDRNNVVERAQNYEHVNRYYTGAQDLDAYGHWQYVPNYDWVWTPNAGPGWAPYSDGSWVWEPYWGWTWVSYEPWGWAPYHYGRWFLYGDNWCWWPGFVTAGFYPVWGPAYVDFIGFGYGRWNFGFGFGWGFNSIGWCPLGPDDDFRPWWGRGNSFNVVNITNVTNINNFNSVSAGLGRRDGRMIGIHGHGIEGSNLRMALTNSRVRRAITVVPTDRFGAGRVARTGRIVSVADLRSANVVRGTLPVVPTRASLSASNRPAAVPRFARTGASNTRFFSRHGSPAPARTPAFTSQAASIQQMMQDHVQQAAIRESARGNTTAGASARGARESSPSNAREFNRGQVAETSPAQARGRAEAQPATETSQRGWRRFGAPASQPEAALRNRQGQQAPESRVNNASGGGASPSSRQPQSGWRQFSRSGPETPRPRSNQSFPANRAPDRTNVRQAPAQQNRRPDGQGWHQFTSRPRPQNSSPDQGRGRDFSRPAPNSGPRDRAGWNRFSREPTPRSNNGSSGYRRPPLELNKPIVTERPPRYNSSSRYTSPWRSGPRYSEPRYSAPRYSAPPRYSEPRYSAPRYSAPRYSAPRYSAPRYSAPHYSAPSRGYSGGGGGGRGRGHGGH